MDLDRDMQLFAQRYQNAPVRFTPRTSPKIQTVVTRFAAGKPWSLLQNKVYVPPAEEDLAVIELMATFEVSFEDASTGSVDVETNFPGTIAYGEFTVGNAPGATTDISILADGVPVSFGGLTTNTFGDVLEEVIAADPSQTVFTTFTLDWNDSDASDSAVVHIFGYP